MNEKFEKLKMQSKDGVADNIARIAALFPNAVTEVAEGGKTTRRIDFDVLRQELSDSVVEGPDERYQFTWPDKRRSMLAANAPISATLRPIRADSLGRDGTAGGFDSENLYIEGDNLEVLKLLQETYYKRVKMIYIDPPYNTGNDFVYEDDFAQSAEDYKAASGQFDAEGNRLVKNVDSNGRFHTDWLNMIYPRLKIAKNLLTQDGVIFISIDDNEAMNLTKVCDEIFGERNRIAIICHKSRASVSSDKIISPNHNMVLFYAKDIMVLEQRRRLIGIEPDLEGFDLDDNDGRGPYRLVPVDGPGGAKKGNPYYSFLGVEGYWRFSKETMQEKYADGLIVKKGNSLSQKYFRTTAQQTRRTVTTWWDDAGLTSTATAKLKKLMDSAAFDTPKPVELIERMLKMTTYQDPGAIVLDFFSGSATTAHAVMQLNAADGGKRKFIMVQLPEACDEKSEAFKAGYKNICEIGKERIRRASRKIREENATTLPKDFDGGFRVLRLDSSNMQDVYYKPADQKQEGLLSQVLNMKGDRTAEDFLFQVMLDLGVPLSAKIEETMVDGKKVFNVDDGFLVACFDDRATDATVTVLAKMQPQYAVLNDAALASDSVATNFGQIFATYSPNTKRRVI